MKATSLIMSTHAYAYKRILYKISCLIILVLGLFFSVAGNTHADEITLADLNAAYNYYSNVSGAPANTTALNPNHSRSSTSSKTAAPIGFGEMADNLYEPIELLSGFLSSMSIIIGLTSLFGAFIRYMQHRVNPLAHPIGIVITLLVLGILLLLLPLVYKLTESGIPFSYG